MHTFEEWFTHEPNTALRYQPFQIAENIPYVYESLQNTPHGLDEKSLHVFMRGALRTQRQLKKQGDITTYNQNQQHVQLMMNRLPYTYPAIYHMMKTQQLQETMPEPNKPLTHHDIYQWDTDTLMEHFITENFEKLNADLQYECVRTYFTKHKKVHTSWGEPYHPLISGIYERLRRWYIPYMYKLHDKVGHYSTHLYQKDIFTPHTGHPQPYEPFDASTHDEFCYSMHRYTGKIHKEHPHMEILLTLCENETITAKQRDAFFEETTDALLTYFEERKEPSRDNQPKTVIQRIAALQDTEVHTEQTTNEQTMDLLSDIHYTWMHMLYDQNEPHKPSHYRLQNPNEHTLENVVHVLQLLVEQQNQKHYYQGMNHTWYHQFIREWNHTYHEHALQKLTEFIATTQLNPTQAQYDLIEDAWFMNPQTYQPDASALTRPSIPSKWGVLDIVAQNKQPLHHIPDTHLNTCIEYITDPDTKHVTINNPQLQTRVLKQLRKNATCKNATNLILAMHHGQPTNLTYREQYDYLVANKKEQQQFIHNMNRYFNH